MNLIQELLALQARTGRLADADLERLAEASRTPLHVLQGLRSFYPHFRTERPKALHVRACRDAACYLRDGGRSRAALHARAAGRDDVEVEDASCLGRCDRAPACTINEHPATNAEATRVLAGELELAALRAERAPPAPRRWELDPHASPAERYSVLREWCAASAPPSALIERLEASGLRGMGGAGFPTGRKWRLVADQPATPRYLVCNADESEPGTFKDRTVLAELPHLIIEGMALGALAIDAERGYVFIRHEYEPERLALEAALREARERGVLGADALGPGRPFDIEIFVSPGGYILGEETALLEAMEGRRGEPRNRPPFPGQRGLYGQPTLINNVETLAQVPRALRTGSADLKLFSVSGDVALPGVIEAPLGTPLRALIERCGGMRDGRALRAFLPGGASTGFLAAERVDVPMEWEALREAGSALGSGAVLIVGEGADLRGLAANLVAFFRNESCGKCVPCRIGTQKAVQWIESGDASDLARLPELDEAMRETSICGLGQAALTPILSVLERFPDGGRGGAS